MALYLQNVAHVNSTHKNAANDLHAHIALRKEDIFLSAWKKPRIFLTAIVNSLSFFAKLCSSIVR